MLSYQLTNTLDAFLDYGTLRSKRRRMIVYSEEQLDVLASELSRKFPSRGEEFRFFKGGANYKYNIDSKKLFKDLLKNVDNVRKKLSGNDEIRKLSEENSDDSQFLERLWHTDIAKQILDTSIVDQGNNAWLWWTSVLLDPIASLFVFRSPLLTAAMIINGIWVTESFHYLSEWEGRTGTGISVYTYNFTGMWFALAGIWFSRKFSSFFSWPLAAIVALAMFLKGAISMGTTLAFDPPTFTEYNLEAWCSMLNGQFISHTAHLYGALSGASTAWLLKKYKFI